VVRRERGTIELGIGVAVAVTAGVSISSEEVMV